MYQPPIYTISVKPSYLTIYNQVFNRRPKLPEAYQGRFLPNANSHNGIISKHSARKMKNSIDWLIQLASDKKVEKYRGGPSFNFKLSFITLTLASVQVHSDNFIKSNLLNQFLIEAKKKWNVKHYIWRAETQRNGNLHFHIICDKFIPWNELRNAWNRVQNKAGYVDAYRQEQLRYHSGGFQVRKELLAKWSYKSQLHAYKLGCANDWQNPNSCDIHSVKCVRNLQAYFSKYFTKNENVRIVKGRLYGCSVSLSKIGSAKCEIDCYISDELDRLIQRNPSSYFCDKYFSVLRISPELLQETGCVHILSVFEKFLNELKSSG